MSASNTEQRDCAQPIERVYEICRSEEFLLYSGGVSEQEVVIVDSRYEERDDGSVFSETTAERMISPPEGAGRDAEPKALRMTQVSTVFPLKENSVRIESEALLPGNSGTVNITFHYSASNEGSDGTGLLYQSCHVEATAVAKSRIPMFGRKLEKRIVASLGSSLDKTIDRINSLVAQTWGE